MKNQGENKLVVKSEKIIDKIKMFLRKIFSKKGNTESVIDIKDKNEVRESFVENIKVHENKKELSVKKLQKEYHKGNIKQEDLSISQINSLLKLYNEQIDDLEKKIEVKKKKLLKYYSSN